MIKRAGGDAKGREGVLCHERKNLPWQVLGKYKEAATTFTAEGRTLGLARGQNIGSVTEGGSGQYKHHRSMGGGTGKQGASLVTRRKYRKKRSLEERVGEGDVAPGKN